MAPSEHIGDGMKNGMQSNYNIEMRLLMHMCCANCALYPIKRLRESGHEIAGYWYNPNIHPADEYERRFAAVEELRKQWGIEMEYGRQEGVEEFEVALDEAAAELGGDGPGGRMREHGNRCRVCYRMRMREVAGKCAEGGYDAFTTSLLVSPYQGHELIKRAGHEAAAEFGVEFFYEDFRPGWPEGQGISRELGLYRQYYCGCHYSKADRDEEIARRKRRGRQKHPA